MTGELFIGIIKAVNVALANGCPYTHYFDGELTTYELELFEDSCVFRVEIVECHKKFRLWILAGVYQSGLTVL
jgi:hypothetical protein